MTHSLEHEPSFVLAMAAARVQEVAAQILKPFNLTLRQYHALVMLASGSRIAS